MRRSSTRAIAESMVGKHHARMSRSMSASSVRAILPATKMGIPRATGTVESSVHAYGVPSQMRSIVHVPPKASTIWGS